MAARRMLVALVAIAALVLAGRALAQTSATPGPVSPALIRLLNSAGPLFRPASPRAHARIAKRTAVRDALREAPWRAMTATGVSLIRLAAAAIDARAGSLAWLVSLEPISESGPAPAGAQTSPPANYFVVAITATNGRFIASAHGYSSP